MITYSLYLESGPRRRKTMVHVFDLLGCVAVGATTEEAIDATPSTIRTYLGYLHRRGEPVDPDVPFEIGVAEHITDGMWLGNGSPYVVFEPDLQPVTKEEIERFLRRFRWVREDLAAWAAGRSDAELDAEADGRTARRILLHILGGPGGYLSAAVGGSSGFSRVATMAERGTLSLPEALLRITAMTEELVHGTTPEQRAAIIERPKDTRTLRKGIRRMLEHDWEHFAELSRREGGPALSRNV